MSSVVARGEAATVVTLPSGGRVTLGRVPEAAALAGFVETLDPNIDLLLAEGFAARGLPTVEIAGPEGPALATAAEDLIAVVASSRVLGDFAVFGPGETGGLADLIEERLLGGGGKNEPPPTSGRRGLFGRFRGR